MGTTPARPSGYVTRTAQLKLAALAAAGLIVLGIVLLAGGEQDAPNAPPLVEAPGTGTAGDFVGIVSEDAFAGDPEYRNRTLDRQRRLGIGLVRQTFDWARIETAPGRYDFSHYDGYVGDLASHGLQLLPLLFGSPAFRSSAPSRGARRGTYPPRHAEQFAAFAARVARRYGPGGTFWAANPELPRLPVRAWQVWNEPSLPVFWASGPDPGEYGRLLSATSRGIRRVDPEAEIVTAGLPESRGGIPFSDFVAGIYEAGAGDAFDTLAIHPYARDAEAAIEAVADARRLLDRHGGRQKRIWVTEVGWASDGPSSPFTVGQPGQASRIARLLPDLALSRVELGIRGIVYFNWQDAPPPPGGRDFWGLHTGLLTLDGRPKRAFRAFRRAITQIKP